MINKYSFVCFPAFAKRIDIESWSLQYVKI